jgi:cytochrome c-type biogenesis protein
VDAAQLGGAFAIGVLATASPCALPLYPGFLAYLAARPAAGASARWLGVAVLGGILTAMLTLGAVIAALQVAIGRVLAVVTPLADLAVIALGVALLLGGNPFARLPAIGGGAAGTSPVRAAFSYGLLYGPVTLPCSGPLLVAVFTLSFGVGAFLEKLAFFLAFGLGFGVPLLAIALVASGRQGALLRAFARRSALYSRAAGIVLVAVGALDLWANLPFALLYLGL